MNTYHTLDQVREKLACAFKEKTPAGTLRNSMVAGFILARPGNDFVKSEMLPHLDVWNYYSDNFTHFFWLGYHLAGKKPAKSIARVAGRDWYFDAETFVEDLENFTLSNKWKYNGGATAILVNALRKETGPAELDFKSAIPLNLESLALLEPGAQNPDNVFFQIFNFAKDLNDASANAVARFSRSNILGSFDRRTVRLILKILPESVRSEFQEALAYSTQNLEGRN